jgi:hypothetical protein
MTISQAQWRTLVDDLSHVAGFRGLARRPERWLRDEEARARSVPDQTAQSGQPRSLTERLY